MFWKRPNGTDPGDVDALRDYVAARLRLALEFATLGAYELVESDGDVNADHDGNGSEQRAAEGAEGSRSASCDQRGPRSRAMRPHVSATRVACEHATSHAHGDIIEYGALLEADDDAAPCLRARSKHRRTGGVDVPEQPCTWTGG
jgi:hypothetical protein